MNTKKLTAIFEIIALFAMGLYFGFIFLFGIIFCTNF